MPTIDGVNYLPAESYVQPQRRAVWARRARRILRSSNQSLLPAQARNAGLRIGLAPDWGFYIYAPNPNPDQLGFERYTDFHPTQEQAVQQYMSAIPIQVHYGK